jgi:hypothetical protein
MQVWDITMAIMKARAMHTMGERPKPLQLNTGESWVEMIYSLNPRQVGELI